MLLSLLISTCEEIEEFTMLTAEGEFIVHKAHESDLIASNR